MLNKLVKVIAVLLLSLGVSMLVRLYFYDQIGAVYFFLIDTLIDISAIWIIFKLLKIPRDRPVFKYNILSVLLLSLSIYGLSQSPLLFYNGSQSVDDNIYRAVVYLLKSVIIAPILEELLFRKVFLQQLLDKGVNIFYCLIIVSVPFALSHAQYLFPMFKPQSVALTFIFSLAVCYVYVRTRNTLLCIIIHSIYNALAFLRWQVTLESLTIQILLFMLSVFTFGALYLYVMRRFFMEDD